MHEEGGEKAQQKSKYTWKSSEIINLDTFHERGANDLFGLLSVIAE